jgi:hypothetical protein
MAEMNPDGTFEIPELVGTCTGFTDNRLAGNPDINVTKAIDITALCGAERDTKNRAILKFSEWTYGRMVQAVECYPNSLNGAELRIHYDYPSDTGSGSVRYAAVNWFGLTPQQLIDIIMQYAPPKEQREPSNT